MANSNAALSIAIERARKQSDTTVATVTNLNDVRFGGSGYADVVVPGDVFDIPSLDSEQFMKRTSGDATTVFFYTTVKSNQLDPSRVGTVIQVYLGSFVKTVREYAKDQHDFIVYTQRTVRAGGNVREDLDGLTTATDALAKLCGATIHCVRQQTVYTRKYKSTPAELVPTTVYDFDFVSRPASQANADSNKGA